MLIGNLDARAEHDSTLPQFARFLRRGADGADEDAAQPALFQFVQTLDRRAAGAGDHVFEGGRMLAGFENHFGASKDGLRREWSPRRAANRPPPRHRSEPQSPGKNARRTAAAQAGDGVQQRFFQLKNQADGGKNFSVKAASPGVADFPSVNAVAEAPTSAGVLGITRMTRAPASSALSSLAIGTPAAIEMSKWPGERAGRISSSNAARWRV